MVRNCSFSMYVISIYHFVVIEWWYSVLFVFVVVIEVSFILITL